MGINHRFPAIFVAVCAMALGTAASASAALPANYQAQAVDNPTPAVNDRFGDGLVNGGDLNGDGEDDIVVGIDEHGTIAGELHIFSGETGTLIRTIPAPDQDGIGANGGAGDNPDAFGTFVGRIGTNRSAPPFTDLGQCPGGTPGVNCGASQGTIDTPDGVPDILASAVGVDVDTGGDDMGMVYVLDGATGAVLKRIVMPTGDRAEQAQNSPTASQGGAFGRTVLSPSGQPPCDGFGGLGACAYGATSSVAIGDVNLDSVPDIGVGASDFTDKGGGTSDPAAENPLCTTTCFQTGRYYMYSGAALAGTPPGTPFGNPLYKIKNLLTEDDDPAVNSRFHREAMGYSIAPVGDLGACSTNVTPVAATDDPNSYMCLNADGIGDDNTTTPDGRPDYILSDHRVDSAGLGDVGKVLAIDGRTGRVMDIFAHPEPQQSAIFGFSNYNQPAIGDAGSSTAPDVYQAAMIQDVTKFAQGEGYVLSGDFRSGGANHYRISTLDDPTPFKIGNFGTSSAGLGNVVGDSRTEIMIGAYGPHAPQVTNDVISDVHIFSPLNDTLLQTIPDPAQDPESGFGRALAPLGDLNEDGFLDFAVGSGGFGGGTCSPCTGSEPSQGRMYLMRSDNSVIPTPSEPGESVAQSGRSLSFSASPKKVKKGKKVTLSGQVNAVANEAGCEPSQSIELQRRKPKGAFATLATVTTDAQGAFELKTKVKKTRFYRAVVDAGAACLAATSNEQKVKVKRK